VVVKEVDVGLARVGGMVKGKEYAMGSLRMVARGSWRLTWCKSRRGEIQGKIVRSGRKDGRRARASSWPFVARTQKGPDVCCLRRNP